MALLVFDYVCTECGSEYYDLFVKSTEMDNQLCDNNNCHTVLTKKIPKTQLDWDALAQGDGASPEAIRHWEKKRKQQKTKEEKSKREHGDIGKHPGS